MITQAQESSCEETETMPTIRKLNPDEITVQKTAKLSARQQTAYQYDALLADFAPGEWAEVDLDDGDNRLTVRNRLEAAANRRGLHLAFRRTSGRMVRFAIEAVPPASAPIEQAPPPAAPEPEPLPAPKKRGRKPAAAA